MKFTINNVWKVNNAEIETNGISVIAGYNDTGKSTILKAIDVFFRIFGNKDKHIENERWKSLRRLILQKEAIFDQMGYSALPRSILFEIYDTLRDLMDTVTELDYHVFKDVYIKILNDNIVFEKEDQKNKAVLESDDFIMKLYIGIDEIKYRTDKEYWEYRSLLDLQEIFNKSYVNKINRKDSIIISGDSNDKKIQYGVNGIELSGEGFPIQNVIYLETKNLLDEFERTRFPNVLRRYLAKEPKIETYEEYSELEQNMQTLNQIFIEVLHGRLQNDGDTIKYADDRIDEPINIRNIASGMKTLLIIQRLVENGSLTSGSWLLIDEPETNLHPEWHIKMAEILVLMKKEMNINIVVSSHSAYFIRALEVKMVSHGIQELGKFYLMQQDRELFNAVDVTDETEKIYEQLYRPLEEL